MKFVGPHLLTELSSLVLFGLTVNFSFFFSECYQSNRQSREVTLITIKCNVECGPVTSLKFFEMMYVYLTQLPQKSI